LVGSSRKTFNDMGHGGGNEMKRNLKGSKEGNGGHDASLEKQQSDMRKNDKICDSMYKMTEEKIGDTWMQENHE